MATVLNLFPSRIRFVNADGSLTAEAYRALQTLMVRVGGPTGPSMDEGALLAIFAAPADAADDTRRYAAELDVRYSFAPATTVPWDRPDAIGLRTPNTGAFTALSAGALSVSGQITSTATVGIAPLVVASTTQVPNLYVARAALADLATTATTASTLTAPGTYPAAATDLPTVIALANALRTAALAKGL